MPDIEPGRAPTSDADDTPQYLPAVDPWADVDTPWSSMIPVLPPPEPPHSSAGPHGAVGWHTPPGQTAAPGTPAPHSSAAPHSQAAPWPRAAADAQHRAAPPPGRPEPPAAPEPHPTGQLGAARRAWRRRRGATGRADALGQPVRAPGVGQPVRAPGAAVAELVPGSPGAAGGPRRRRWPRAMLLLGAATLACCCGVPGYLGWPMWQQYPASAALPSTVADLRLLDDAASKGLAARLESEMKGAHLLADGTFAGVYTDSRRKRVTVFGATGFWLQPDSELDAELGRVAGQYGLTVVSNEDSGSRGRYLRCGTGRSGGSAVVVCGWADHGTLATGVFTRLNVTDSAALLRRMQEEIVTRA